MIFCVTYLQDTKTLPVKSEQLINKIFRFLQVTRKPIVWAFDGYGDADDVIIQGYVLSLSPRPRRTYRQNLLINLFSLVRLFVVRPKRFARVLLEWNGEIHEQVTDKYGFFKFEWKPINPLTAGWQKAKVSYVTAAPASVAIASSECEVFIPHVYQYNFISDIDDTFLISHSSSIFKRLYVLFSKNARSRKPFEGVVNHYRLLAKASAGSGVDNPFFYVSSSEWNLYHYIKEFCRKHEMPRGVFLLSTMKRFRHLLSTGQGKHATKYVRIARILKSYPRHKYILLGDNSQKDPEIYYSVVRDFPGMIHAVYIRNINAYKVTATGKFISGIETMGVKCCFFKHSAEAIEHSRSIGLIPFPQEPEKTMERP
jgi:phosphatidate phosphatase APP1